MPLDLDHEITEHLLSDAWQAGAEVNAGTDQKWTSLHLAAKEQNTGVVRVLLDNDADGALKDSYGATPLHYAVQLADLNHFNALHSVPRCIVKGPDKKGAPPAVATAQVFVSVLPKILQDPCHYAMYDACLLQRNHKEFNLPVLF